MSYGTSVNGIIIIIIIIIIMPTYVLLTIKLLGSDTFFNLFIGVSVTWWD